MKARIKEMIAEYNKKHNSRLGMKQLAVIIYADRNISIKSAQITFSRLINGKRKNYNPQDIQKLAAILETNPADLLNFWKTK